MDFDVQKVAKLAHLSLKPAEIEKLGKDLKAILGYVDKLSALQTDAVVPTSHVLDMENVYRTDEVKPSAMRDDVLAHAPLTESKFFKVPKVVDKSS